MEKYITGNRYKYLLKLKDYSGYCCFSILAICEQTGRCSSINNLNQILADLDVDPTNPKYEDSSWVLSVREGRKQFNRALGLFDRRYLTFLEEDIDEDRLYGEWENHIV